jgi:hypothetical protein
MIITEKQAKKLVGNIITEVQKERCLKHKTHQIGGSFT